MSKIDFFTKEDFVHSINRLLVKLYIFHLPTIPLNFLLKSIFSHEEIGNVHIVYLYPIAIVLEILLFIYMLSLFFASKRGKFLSKIFTENSKIFPVILGIFMAFITLDIVYGNFSSIAHIKDYKSIDLKESVKSYAEEVEGLLIKNQYETLREKIDSSKVLNNNTNISSQFNENSINAMDPGSNPLDIKVFEDFNMERKDDGVNNQKSIIQGGVILDRDYKLEASLGEKKRILAYLKKDNFSNSKNLRIHGVSPDKEIVNRCFRLNYLVKYKDEKPEQFFKIFCNIPNLGLGFMSPQGGEISSLEFWITEENDYDEPTNYKNPISIIATSEDKNEKRYRSLSICIEGFNEGMPNEKYKSIIGLYIINGIVINNLNPVEVIKGQCMASDYSY